MSARAERLYVRVAGGEDAPAELPRAGLLVIGSSSERAGLCVEGQGVAEVHCAIGRTKDGSWGLKDLGSEFGTMVNGKRVTKARLAAGDEILLGSRKLVLVTDPGADLDAAPAPERAAPSAPAPPPAKPRAAAAPLPRIGGYRLLRRLGRGAMGEVYLAVQESLDREVALKVLAPRLAADADFVARFQAEARAAAALSHQNVVTVHDVGQDGGLHYLSMEYMDKGSLEERVAEAPLGWPQVLDVLHDAASGLVYAESRGIVHRDIKPANLMQNHHGATKIADLGLATQAEAEAEEEPGGRRILGTPHFISPEQVRGAKADCRSDIYSLGATAYRLLSGHTPFEGKNSREILRAKLLSDPTPLRERVGDLPEDVERLVERMMEREPDDRFPSAGSLLGEVDRIRAGRSAAAAAPAGGGASLLVKVGLPLLVVAAAAVALPLVLGGDGGEQGDGDGPRTNGGVELSGGDGPPPVDVDTAPPVEIGDANGGAPADSDTAERLFEIEAENELLRLSQRELAPADRSAALRELAGRFQGTTAATQALERADAIDAEIAAAAAAEREREERLGGVIDLMRSAAALDAHPVDAGKGLTALRAVDGQEALAADDAFVAQRAQLEAELFRAAIDDLSADMKRARALRDEGRWMERLETLQAAYDRTELPLLTPERTPAGAVELLELRRRLREMIEDHAAEKRRFEHERARADAKRVADALRAGKGLGGELRGLDLPAATRRLEALVAKLETEDARAWAEGALALVRSGASALEAVGTSYSEWRRKTISDPRGGTAEVVGADASGLSVVSNGATERLPWTVFGGATRELTILFRERLERDWTAAERSAIARLLLLSSLGETLSETAEMFTPGAQANFTQRDAADALSPFDEVGEWAADDEVRALVARERGAAALLVESLRYANEESWPRAVAGLERLLAGHRDSLLVRLLSDGVLPELAPEAPEDAPADEGEGATAEGGSGSTVGDGAPEDGAPDDGGAAPGEGEDPPEEE